ncbi:MAG: NUDIX domain-containing protein [Pseudomonadota bacterium]
MSFADSYLGGLRALVGPRPLLAVGVRVLVEDSEGRFLILQRSDSGHWGLPGGSMELGESLMDAVHRETREETNLTLTDVRPFGLSSDPRVERYTYPNRDVLQSVSLLVHAGAVDGPLAANDGEALAFRFVRPEKIDPATFTAPEWPTFGHWRRHLETGAFQIV